MVQVKVRAVVAGAGLALLSACGGAPAPGGMDDPYEATNRSTHAFNLGVDKNVLRPLALGTSRIVPPPVSRGVTRFADNLSLTGVVVNDILQLKVGDAVHNTLRFAVNSTVGLGGVFDPAGQAGVPERPTDFGETLHVWGMGEGAYVELPLLGPSTERDAIGRLADTALDPLRVLLPQDQRAIVTGATIYSKVDQRGRYSETLDSVLYESADSYAQARLLYLQNRRFELGQTPDETDFEDPYAE